MLLFYKMFYVSILKTSKHCNCRMSVCVNIHCFVKKNKPIIFRVLSSINNHVTGFKRLNKSVIIISYTNKLYVDLTCQAS